MAGNKLLLDTNVVIDILRGSAKIRSIIEQSSQTAIPSVVLGELYYGAFNSSDPKKHVAQINDLLQIFETVEVNEEVAENYGTIKSELKKAGKPILENDIWIAATAKTNGFKLVTSDAHFNHILDLNLVNP